MKSHAKFANVNDPLERVSKQCDQIGRYFSIWATLGYFLLNKFLPKQTSRFVVIIRFQTWFDVDILAFQNLGEHSINFLVTLSLNQNIEFS